MSYFINPAIAPYKKSHHDSLRKFHKDGLKDIFVKIKLKAKETINYFKQLPKSKKIVLLISQILKMVIAIWNVIEHNKLPNQLAENRIEKVSLKKLIGRVESKNKWRNEELLTLKPELQKLNQKIDELKTLSNNLTGKYGNDFNVNNQFVKPLLSQQKYLSNTINKYESTIERNKGIIEDLNNDLDNNGANLKSIETRTNLRVFISFLTMFASSVADYIALRRTDSKIKRDRAIRRLIDKKIRHAILDAGVKGMKRGRHVKAHDPEYLKRIKGGGGMTASTSNLNLTGQNRKGFKYGSKNKLSNILHSGQALTRREVKNKAAQNSARKAAANAAPKKTITRQAAKLNFKPHVKALALAGAGTAALIAGSKALANHRRKKALEARRAQRNQQ